MSFLVEQLRQRTEYQIPQPKVCYYYCLDTETGNGTSIVSTLILELLDQLNGLKIPFVEWYKAAQTSTFDPAANFEKLEDFLQKMLDAIERPIFIVIDALDECDMESRDRLLAVLKSLSGRTSNVKIVLSSRPQEEILEQLDGTAQIELAPNAERDGIIVDCVVEKKLPHLSPDVKALIKDKLSGLAQGNAIWTRMVVDLIRIRRIKAKGPMEHFLKDLPLPHKLSKLYNDLLCRCTSNDSENLKLASIALKVLVVTRRPLSILELAWAVTLGATQHITTVGALAELADPQRVIGFIHPFIAQVNFGNAKKHQVRLVHQSVKEFITNERNLGQASDVAVAEGGDVAFGQPRQSLEAFVLDICIRYLLLEDVDHRDLFSEVQVGILELPQESDLFNDNEGPVDYDPACTWESWEEDMICYDPSDRGFGEFFVYASCYWLKHFGAITDGPLPSLASIESLCKAGSTRLHNWTQQNCRPGCVMIPRFQFDSRLYDPLSITSLYGPVSMLRRMVENSDFGCDTFLPETAMRSVDQILQWGDISRLRMLFSSNVLGHQLQTLDFFRLVVNQWRHPGVTQHNWDFAFDLVDDVSEKMVEEKWGKEVFCLAARAGCVPILRRLITSAQHKAEFRRELLHRAEDTSEDTALHIAIRTGDMDVVKMLTEAGDSLGSRDQCGSSTPPHLTIESGNEDIVRHKSLEPNN